MKKILKVIAIWVLMIGRVLAGEIIVLRYLYDSNLYRNTNFIVDKIHVKTYLK